MAVNLSIREVPDEWAEKLKERAKRNHRSQQGELLAILEEVLRPKRLTMQEVSRKIQEMNFSTPAESTQLIREARDARYNS